MKTARFLRLCGSCVLTVFLYAAPAALGQSVSVDFEDGDLSAWEIVDGVSLGELGPSTWEIRPSQLGLDGNALYQDSNIWGDADDHMMLGTIIYFKEQEFTNFRAEVDVVANDNDGMGFVWGYQELAKHYRIQLMNDRWPELPPLDGHHGPMVVAHKRIDNQSPWYELLAVIDDPAEYIPYPQGSLIHWTLEVVDGDFTFTSLDVATGNETIISGFDDEYESGFIGIQLYAQSAEFDNFSITSLPGRLTSDLTGNGFVDFEDLTVLLANWNKDVTAADGNLVEPLITVVNFDDLTVLLADWTGPGPAGSPEAALGEAVPEPSTLMLAALGLIGVCCFGRRRKRVTRT